MQFIKEWLEAQEKEHTSEWANKIIKNVRINMKPFISKEKAELGMAYLLGKQDLTYVKNLFINAAKLNLDNVNRPQGWGVNAYDSKTVVENLQYGMTGVNFVALPLWERIRNIMIAEMKKMGIVINCRAVDPASTVSRKRDEALIKNKKAIQNDLSKIYTKIGQKPVDIEAHEDRFGEKLGEGNIEEFANMNFDESNPDDVATFMKYFHKLTWEIAAQKTAGAVIDFNALDQKIDLWVTDFIAKKAIAGQVYRNQVNGQLQAEYVAPETVFVFGGGRRKDFNDANAKVIEISISVREMLNRIGDSFDFKEQWGKLIMAVMFTTGREITGIHADNRWLWNKNAGANYDAGNLGTGAVSINDFMQLKVTLGYVEWVSQVQYDYGQEITNSISTSKNYYQDNQPPNRKKYQNKARFETPTYCSYYLALSANEQILYDFGKLPYQDIEGYNDMEANFTIITWKEIGDPLAIMAIPLVDIFHEAWYKFKHEVRQSKPRGVGRNLNSIMQMAEEIYQESGMNMAGKVQAMTQYLNQSADELYMYPEVEGKTLPISGNQQTYQIDNGLTEGVMKWWTVMLETEQKIIDLTTGNSPLRQGDAPATRASMNNEFKALENSENSTYYIPDGITFMLQSMATKIMLFTQDIVTYKTYDTLAYKFLCDLVGDETLEQIEGMGKKAMHRFGILVESLNQAPQRAKIDRRIEIGLQNKTLTNAQVLLIEDIKSPKEAGLVLAYLEQRNEKLAQKNAIQMQESAHAQQMELQQMEIKKILLKGQLDIQAAQIPANAQIQAHLINQQGGITKVAMKHSADVEQIEMQANANIREQQQQLNETGKTTPDPAPIAPAPQMSNPNNVPTPPVESAIKQQMDMAAPQSTEFGQG